MAYTELYVRADAAGGGDGTTDTNSGGTGALTWAEMLAYGGSVSLAGIRFNVKNGAYARSGGAETFTVTAGAATTAAPCAVRGFNSTAGDLDTPSRTRGQALTVTNFPVVTYTSSSGVTFPAFCEVSNISMTSDRAGATATSGAGDLVHNCKLANTTASSASGVALAFGSTTSMAVECDISGASSSTSAYALTFDVGNVVNCLITAGSAGSNGVNLTSSGALVHCMVRDAAIGARVTGGALVYGCSFRNVATTVIEAGSGPGLVMNTVAWMAGGTSKWFNSTTSVRAHMQINNAVGNSGAADVNEGDWTVRDETAITSDPFTSSTELTLNNTSGGGADVKGVGTWTYLDLGAWQVQASAGSSGGGPLIGGKLLRS
jgi:hypothetical protein